MTASNQTVLIVGAGGFIGLHIVRIFERNGWQIFALVHKNIPEELSLSPNVKVIQVDITDKSAIDKIPKCDLVIQVAGVVSDIGSESTFRKVNFEAVKAFSGLAKSKFIFISSTDVYGIKDFSGQDEDSLIFEKNPINPYSKYKIESEKWIKANLNKNNYGIIRPAAVYGDGDRTMEQRVVSFLKKTPFIIHFGKWKGQNRWPLANVENVAKAVYLTGIRNDFNGEAINILDEKHTTIDEFYRYVAQKHFQNKKFYTINLPFWLGYIIGLVSTCLSNSLNLKYPLFEPSLYALYHVSSNLDFSCEKMKKILDI